MVDSVQILELVTVPVIGALTAAVGILWRKLEQKDRKEDTNTQMLLDLKYEVGSLSGKHAGIEELGDRVLREVREVANTGYSRRKEDSKQHQE